MAISEELESVLRARMGTMAAAVQTSDLLNAISALSGTEAGYIDAVTPGTAAVNKALVLGSSGEIATITSATITTLTSPTVNSTNIDAGASGVAGSVDVFPATGSRGKLIISAVNTSSGDFNVTLTNAPNSTDGKTITFPALTGYVALSTASLSLAEVDVLDAVTPGTATASKAVVLDASKDNDGIRHLTLGTIGATGVVGQLILADGANPGYKALVQTDAQSANLTVHVPDPGAMVDAYVALSTAALTAAEVDVLDAVTPGTGAASKAAVLDSSRCFAIGTEEFTTAGTTGIIVDGVTKHSAIQFYYTDGGVKLAAGYTEAFRNGYLVSVAITGDTDVSTYTAHDYIYLAQSVSTRGGVGASWASLLVAAGKTITTTAGVCDFSAFNASVDVPSTAVIGTGTWACGYAAGGNLGGTHTGKAAGYRVRVPSAGKWDAGIRIEPTSCVEYLQVGTASFSAAGSGIPLDGVNQHSGAEIYFDDGGTMLAAGYTEAVMTGFLVSTAITTADVSIYTVHDYIYLAASVSTAGGVGASWASLLAKTGAVLTTTSGLCDFSAFNASCDVPSGATIGTGTFVAGISMGGNLGGTHTGKAVAFRVRSPSAGAWDGLCDIPSALTGSSNGGGSAVYIDCYIAGVAARITAKYVS